MLTYDECGLVENIVGNLSTLDTYCKRLHHIHGYALTELSDVERLSILIYCDTVGGCHRRLNRYLSKKYGNIDYDALRYGLISNSALDKLPHYSGVAFRGIDLSFSTMDRLPSLYSVNRDFEWKAFTSASVREDVASAFGSVLFVINSIAGRVVDGFSPVPGEEEIIFPPGSRFRVLGFQRKPSTITFELQEL